MFEFRIQLSQIFDFILVKDDNRNLKNQSELIGLDFIQFSRLINLFVLS